MNVVRCRSSRDTVVAVPSVGDCFVGAPGHGACLLGRSGRDPLLTLTVLIERLKVDTAAWGPVVFSDDDHTMAPLRRLCNRLDDAHADVAVNVSFHLVLPMEGNGAWRRDVTRFCGGIQVDL